MKAASVLAALAIATVAASLAPARGATIVAFDFGGNDGTQISVSPTTIDPDVTSTAIYRGSGVTNTSSRTGSFDNYPVGNAWKTDAADAEAARQFDTFTITPVLGHTLSLNSLTYAFFSQNGTSGYGDPAFNSSASYSTDGVNFTPIVTTNNLSATVDGSQSGSATATADLSGIADLQNFFRPLTIHILLYHIGGYQDGGLGRVAGDDLTLDGAFDAPAVPEPASLALLALGAGALLARRKRA